MSNLRQTEFVWTIHNFDLAPHLTGERLESPFFSIDLMKNEKFSLLLYPRGREDQNYVSLFLIRHSDKEAEDLFLQYELCLIDASGYCENQKSSTSRIWTFVQKGYEQFCQRHLLMGCLKYLLLPNNTLTVRCRLSLQEHEDSDGHVYCPPDWVDLSRDFGRLLECGIHSDLIIEATGKEFRVHRALLEARCPGLISQLVKSEKPDRMLLPSVEASILQVLLDYVYTGIFKDVEKFEEMFVAANSYKIAGLKALLYPYPASISAKTVIEYLRLSFTWVIPDFKSFPQSNREVSYILVAEDMPESSWMKVVLFSKVSDEGKKITFLKFQKLRNYQYGALYFEIQASDKNNELVLLKEYVNVFENGKFEIPFDVDTDSVEMSEGGDLELHFDIRTSVNDGKSSVQEINFSHAHARFRGVLRNWQSLYEDLLQFFKSMKKGDVTLNVGSRELAAHKAVLCSRSEVFCKMFEHDSRESRTNSVNIEDVDEETMTSLLMYMYCSKTDLDDLEVARVIKLYSAADKYQLLLLKGKCGQYLKSNINAENFGDVLLVADAHSDEALKMCVYTFITDNARELLHSQGGLNVLENRGDLYRDIFNVLLRCLSAQENTIREWNAGEYVKKRKLDIQSPLYIPRTPTIDDIFNM